MMRVLAVLCVVSLGVLAFGTGVAQAQVPGSIAGWGQNDYNQCDVLGPNADFVGISAGFYHSLGLKADGTIVAWLYSLEGQCDIPAPNENFVAVAAGYEHSLGLKSNGTVVAWGKNDQFQCDVPAPNADFAAIAAGQHHSLGLKSDSTVVAWGWNNQGQCDVPAQNESFIAVAGGYLHSLAIKSDGTIVTWGDNRSGQCDVPPPNADFIAVAGGGKHSLGLKSDGTVVTWGTNNWFQCDVPAPNTDFVAIAGGYWHSLGAKADGTIVPWGGQDASLLDVPTPNEDFVAVAGGANHSLGLRHYETPVETFFYAALVHENRNVQLRWMLPSLTGGMGLRVYRAFSADGPYDCLTPELLLDIASGGYVDETAWPGGTFWYELRAVLHSGEEMLATDVHPSVSVPGKSSLGIRYVVPNPCSGSSSIGYTLPEAWRSARLSVHDAAGRLIRRLDPVAGSRGYAIVDWDGTTDSGERVPSGVYFVRLEVDGVAAAQKMVILR